MQFGVILFFILCFTSAKGISAPNDRTVVSPELDSSANQQSSHDTEDRLRAMDISIPKKDQNEIRLRKDSVNFYYPFRQSVSPRLGLVFDPDKLKDNFQLVFLFGVSYLWPSSVGHHWETGFDIHTGGTGYLQIGKRYIFNRTEKFRPFFRPSVSMRLKSSEGIASIVNHRNVQLRLAGGVEDLLYSPLSAAITCELAIGYDQSFLVMGVGYSWAW